MTAPRLRDELASEVLFERLPIRSRVMLESDLIGQGHSYPP